MLPSGLAVARVVDLGCGTARFVPLLRRLLGVSIIGVEPSLKMLADREVAAGPFVAGCGEAIPLADGSVDLVFLSMVYHHLRPAEALPELRRIIRPGGHVLVRTSTREGVEAAVEYLRFFPEALEGNRARMPSRAGLVDAFAEHEFASLAHRVIHFPFEANRDDYCRKIALRAFSSFQMMSDEAFAQGLAALERYCSTAEHDGPIDELVDHFLFRRDASDAPRPLASR
jgi:SAM-dependent methyltransferase